MHPNKRSFNEEPFRAAGATIGMSPLQPCKNKRGFESGVALPSLDDQKRVYGISRVEGLILKDIMNYLPPTNPPTH